MKHQMNIQGVSKLAIKTWHQISEGLIQYIGQVLELRTLKMYLSTDKFTISIKWLQLDSNPQPLLRKRTPKHLAKLVILAIW